MKLSRLQLAGQVRSGKILLGEEALREMRETPAPGYQRYKSAHDLIRALRQSIYVKFQAQMHEAELAEPGDPPRSAILPWPYEW